MIRSTSPNTLGPLPGAQTGQWFQQADMIANALQNRNPLLLAWQDLQTKTHQLLTFRQNVSKLQQRLTEAETVYQNMQQAIQSVQPHTAGQHLNVLK